MEGGTKKRAVQQILRQLDSLFRPNKLEAVDLANRNSTQEIVQILGYFFEAGRPIRLRLLLELAGVIILEPQQMSRRTKKKIRKRVSTWLNVAAAEEVSALRILWELVVLPT
jgi:hypothetical protein